MDNKILAQFAPSLSAGKVEQDMFHYYSHRIAALIVFSLVVLVLVVDCEAQPAASTKFSDQGFPTDEFFGGIFVDLDGLQNNPRYRLFPLDKLIPGKTSFDYLDSELISQFAIFLKPCDESKRGSHQRFEIATVGKLRNPESFDVKAELAKWSNRTTPWRTEHEVEVEEIQVEGKSCFKFESGTILNSIQRPGNVQGYDREGKKTNGINVGQNGKMRFIKGGDNDSKVVISVSDFSDSDLIDGSVIIDLHLDAFLTRKLSYPFPKSQIYLLASDGKTSSKPIDFDTKSFFVHRFSFPRKLPVLDAESGEPKGTVDLIDDFARDGNLQVVLRCLQESSYTGIQASDFGLRIPSHEYLGVVGDYVVVAQSLNSLKQMMKMEPQAIAEKIALKDGLQVEASFDLVKSENRTAFQDFLESRELQHVLSVLSFTTNQVQCSINMDREQVFSAKIGMSAEEAKSKARRILSVESRRNRRTLTTEAYRSLSIQNALARGRTRSVLEMPSEPRLFPDISVDRESLGGHFQSLAENLEKSVQVNGDSDGLAVGFLWPFGEPDDLDQTDLLMLASLRRYRSYEHFSMKRFHLAEQMERRLISEFPDSDGLWASLAFQLAYNTSTDFDGGLTRYFWVQKGIDVLLDVAESNENLVAPVWEAAKFIGLKIGTSDEHDEFQKLFASDKTLHDRVGKYVDVEKCKDGDGNVDCQLIARGMMVHCRDRIRKSDMAKSSIGDLELEVQPILMRGHHARWLDQQFDSRAATVQWQKVLEEFLELGEMDPEYGAWHESKLAEIRMRLSPAWQEVFAFYSKSQKFQNAKDLEQSFLQIDFALGRIQKLVDEDPGKMEVARNVFKDLIWKARSQFKQMEKPIPALYRDLLKKPAPPWLR